MHYALVALALISTALGYWGVYDACTHGTGTGQISYAGVFLGLAFMMVGPVFGVLARVAQAEKHRGELLEAIAASERSPGHAETAQPAASIPAAIHAEGELQKVPKAEVPSYLAAGWTITAETTTGAFMKKV